MLNEIKKHFIDNKIKQITNENYEEVMDVYITNPQYFLLINGKIADVNDCKECVEAVPPNFDINNKLFFGVWENQKCTAVVDLLIGYPDTKCIWIGLLLVHGDLHRNKIGENTIKNIFTAVQSCGFESIQLAVADNNVKALAFWRKQGFKDIRSTVSLDGLKVIVMEKSC